MIALAQVNRASEDRQDHRPRLSHLDHLKQAVLCLSINVGI